MCVITILHVWVNKLVRILTVVPNLSTNKIIEKVYAGIPEARPPMLNHNRRLKVSKITWMGKDVLWVTKSTWAMRLEIVCECEHCSNVCFFFFLFLGFFGFGVLLLSLVVRASFTTSLLSCWYKIPWLVTQIVHYSSNWKSLIGNVVVSSRENRLNQLVSVGNSVLNILYLLFYFF